MSKELKESTKMMLYHEYNIIKDIDIILKKKYIENLK